jgi:hypothetical protein
MPPTTMNSSQVYKGVSCEALDGPTDRCRMNATHNIDFCLECQCNKSCTTTLVFEKKLSSPCTSLAAHSKRSAFSGTILDINSTMIVSNPFVELLLYLSSFFLPRGAENALLQRSAQCANTVSKSVSEPSCRENAETEFPRKSTQTI